ncbi:DUF6683 family protein [Deinococcus yavapaiensis]|uniref:SdpC family antimicrobial peptide n=1 Tax=Deinococcus yavapaiensis KR-236 TaxID=694435 RepID=A0A318SAN8_9DEIO|nr:DUF6683 family protein [Deinococcus yavapaiensis]PYE56429.1 hypothetical protein DES52_101233 [Deinococcus yavapaiensis KR-236]
MHSRIRHIVLLALALGAVHASAQSGASTLSFDKLFAPPVVTDAAKKADFSYTVTPESKKKAQDDYLASLAKANANAAKTLEGQLARNDVGAIYARIASALGLKRGDLADTFTAYLFLNWSIVNNETDDRPDDKQRLAALRAQVANLLAGNESVRDAPARSKMGAELELLFVTLQASWQSAAQQGSLKPFSESVGKLFKDSMGVDLKTVSLTTQGMSVNN